LPSCIDCILSASPRCFVVAALAQTELAPHKRGMCVSVWTEKKCILCHARLRHSPSSWITLSTIASVSRPRRDSLRLISSTSSPRKRAMSSIDVVGNTNLKIWRGQNSACVRGTSTLAGIGNTCLSFCGFGFGFRHFPAFLIKSNSARHRPRWSFILLNWGRIVYQQGLSAVEADCGNDPAR